MKSAISATPNTQTNSDLKFLCKICRQPGSFPAEDYATVRREFARLGLEPMIPTVCDKCQHEMETPRNAHRDGMIIKLPPPNLDQMLDLHNSRRRIRKPLPIPRAFMDTDPNHPDIDNRAFKRVSDYNMARNLLIRGESGAGKTRAAWTLLARLWSKGVDVKGYSSSRLVEEAEEKRKSGWLPWWKREIISVPVLLIDDIGNEQWGEDLMFDLIKRRGEKGKKTVATTQHTSKTLYADAKNQKRVAAIIRRLLDDFEDIPFRKPKLKEQAA
jgi:hypothetical protein